MVQRSTLILLPAKGLAWLSTSGSSLVFHVLAKFKSTGFNSISLECLLCVPSMFLQYDIDCVWPKCSNFRASEMAHCIRYLPSRLRTWVRSLDSHGGGRELTTESWPLTSMHVLQYRERKMWAGKEGTKEVLHLQRDIGTVCIIAELSQATYGERWSSPS